MPNIIDTQQLQATAQVAKSFILEQDTANIDTIITALGGSSTPAQKPQPTLSLSAYPDIQLTYQGNGEYRIGDYNESYGGVAFILDTNHDGEILVYGCDGLITSNDAPTFNTNQFTLYPDEMKDLMAREMLIAALESNNFASKVISVESAN